MSRDISEFVCHAHKLTSIIEGVYRVSILIYELKKMTAGLAMFGKGVCFLGKFFGVITNIQRINPYDGKST